MERRIPIRRPRPGAKGEKVQPVPGLWPFWGYILVPQWLRDWGVNLGGSPPGYCQPSLSRWRCKTHDSAKATGLRGSPATTSNRQSKASKTEITSGLIGSAIFYKAHFAQSFQGSFNGCLTFTADRNNVYSTYTRMLPNNLKYILLNFRK